MTKRHQPPEARTPVEARYLAYMAAESMSVETQRQRIYLLRGLGGSMSLTRLMPLRFRVR